MTKKAIMFFAAILVSLVSTVMAYHLLTPKVIFNNHSSINIDELVVQLPTSRISMGPVSPTTSQTIYFSRQEEAGSVTYHLLVNGDKAFQGEIGYPIESQTALTFEFNLSADEQLSVDANYWKY